MPTPPRNSRPYFSGLWSPSYPHHCPFLIPIIRPYFLGEVACGGVLTESAYSQQIQDENRYSHRQVITHPMKPKLVGGWTNASEKYDRQMGNLPQIVVKIKHVWNHHLAKLGKWNSLCETGFLNVGCTGRVFPTPTCWTLKFNEWMNSLF